MFRRLSVALVVVTTLGVSACRDSTFTSADLSVLTDTLVAYSFTGADPSLPTALASAAGTTVPADGSTNYDVVFDIDPNDPSGHTVDLIPARIIVSPIAGSHSVGILTSPTIFDSLFAAPNVYYRPDTTTAVSVGQTVVLQMHRSTGATICLYLADPRIYAKLVIDSVNTTTRSIHFRQTVDPNCGYRSLIVGLPTS